MSTLLILIVVLVLVVDTALVLAWVWSRRLAAQAEIAVPRIGTLAKVPGGAIHYTDEGPADAPVVVLIHGLSGQLQNLTYGLSAPLSSDHRVIALDRPGCGYSERDSDDLARLPEQARMIGALQDDLRVPRPPLDGHSLGGAIALAMALDRPEKTGALALLCPLTHPTEGAPAVFKPLEVRSQALRRFIGHTLAAPLAQRNGPAALAAVFAPEPWPEDFLTRGGGALGLRPKAYIAASADVTAAGDAIDAQSRRYAAELKTPGGILYGAEDAILDPDTHGKAMEAHGLAYEALPGRGHMIPITAPDACADFIRRMAAQASAQPTA